MMYYIAISILVNFMLVVIVKKQHDHIVKLQRLVQPLDPIEFDGYEWYDCDYESCDAI